MPSHKSVVECQKTLMSSISGGASYWLFIDGPGTAQGLLCDEAPG